MSKEKKIINSEKAPAAIGAYSQGIMTEGFLFTSGQLPVDPSTGKIEEGGMKVQAARAISNLGEVLHAGGMRYADLVKVTVYITDMNKFSEFNEVYAGYFNGSFPARSCVGVASLPLGAEVEVEGVAYKNE